MHDDDPSCALTVSAPTLSGRRRARVMAASQEAGLEHLARIAAEQSAAMDAGLQTEIAEMPLPAVTATPALIDDVFLEPHSRRSRLPAWWPVTAILAVQAVLSLRLVWSNTTFQDEALYLWAGHLEWDHLLHGMPISAAALPSYFSGAPTIYPLLAALADMGGGLALARILSLAFYAGSHVIALRHRAAAI